MFYRISRWGWVFLDWLYPPQCGGCGKLGIRWCEECHNKTKIISPPLCSRCGQSQFGGEECPRCRSNPPLLDSVRSWALYEGPVRNALLKLKYYRDLGLGDTLAVHLIHCYQQSEWSVDMVIPVPLGSVREANRGYNQAALLARPLAWKTGLEYKPIAITRIRETQSQVDLNYSERRKNVERAFKAKKEIVFGKSVMVVDDITTSGSTLDACAEALLDANAKRVFGLTLARTPFSN